MRTSSVLKGAILSCSLDSSPMTAGGSTSGLRREPGQAQRTEFETMSQLSGRLARRGAGSGSSVARGKQQRRLDMETSTLTGCS